MEPTSTEITSIRRLNDIEKSTRRTHRYFIDFESGIHVKTSMSNRCHNFHVDSLFKIDVISTNFLRRTSMSNRSPSTKMCPLGYKKVLRKNKLFIFQLEDFFGFFWTSKRTFFQMNMTSFLKGFCFDKFENNFL